MTLSFYPLSQLPNFSSSRFLLLSYFEAHHVIPAFIFTLFLTPNSTVFADAKSYALMFSFSRYQAPWYIKSMSISIIASFPYKKIYKGQMEAANVPDGGTGEYLTTLINHKLLCNKFSVCFAISQTMFEKPIHFCKCHYWDSFWRL